MLSIHPPSTLCPSRGHPVHIWSILPQKATKSIDLEGHLLHANTPIIILRTEESTMYKIYGVRHTRFVILDFYRGGVQT